MTGRGGGKGKGGKRKREGEGGMGREGGGGGITNSKESTAGFVQGKFIPSAPGCNNSLKYV